MEPIDEPLAQRLHAEQVGLPHERRHVHRFERIGAFAAKPLVIGGEIPLPQPVGRRRTLPREPLAPRGCRRVVAGVYDHEGQGEERRRVDVLQDLGDPPRGCQPVEQHADAERAIVDGGLGFRDGRCCRELRVGVESLGDHQK